MWFVEALEIVDRDNNKTGKYRLTARCDEPEQGPSGNPKCYHATPEECFECEACDLYTSRTAGFPTRAERDAQMAKMQAMEEKRRILRAKVFIAGAQAMRELLIKRLTEAGEKALAFDVAGLWYPSWGTDPGKFDGAFTDDLPAFIDELIKDMPTPDVPTKA